MAIALAGLPRQARAADPQPASAAEAGRATLLPAVVQDGRRRAAAATETDLAALLAQLDELLAETSRDLGLRADGTRGGGPDPVSVTDAEMLELARKNAGPVLAATLSRDGDELELRLSLAAPGRRAVLTRTERFAKGDLSVRAVVMLRDVVTDAGVATKAAPSNASAILLGQPLSPGKLVVPVRSEGRAILAANATIFGGMMGFSVERAGGSDDPRLLYPLLAVGAGVGLGASLLIAGEWDVGVGDAWFLSSGALWPTAASHLLYEGRFGGASGHPGPDSDRWAFGLVGGTVGLTLSTLSLSLGDMPTGGAVLAHSGGALGLAFGGLTEWFVRGDTRAFPFAGLGYGAALGWLAAAGVATTRVQLAPLRVLSVDLGAVLGGLAGAALGSPLVFDGPTSTETRGWVGAIGGGALVGAGVALFLTRGATSSKTEAPPVVKIAQGLSVVPEVPEIGVLGDVAPASIAPGGAAVCGAGEGSRGADPVGCGARALARAGEDTLLPPAAPAIGVRLRGRW